MSDTLEDGETQNLKELLIGKTISEIFRHREKETFIQFSDGARLFIAVNHNQNLEFSVTEISH